MLFFLTALANPLFIQEGIHPENSYFQEMDSEEELNDAATFLAFHDTENPSGRVMAISVDSAEESEEKTEKNEQQVDSKIDAEQSEENAEANPEQISLAMEKEFGELRMVQLANFIAGDMGMITKVTLER